MNFYPKFIPKGTFLYEYHTYEITGSTNSVLFFIHQHENIVIQGKASVFPSATLNGLTGVTLVQDPGF